MKIQRILLIVSVLVSATTLIWAQTTQPARLGVNTTTPQRTLDVNGAINIALDSAYQINGTPVLRTPQVFFSRVPFTSLYVGPGAGQNNTTGLENHFVGYQAGQSNTTGNKNHFNGYRAGLRNTTGSDNHFSGFEAGQNNTTGQANHFVGVQAGRSNTTGNFNHFSGYLAGGDNTTGSQNHFSGYLAGNRNTTGNQNHFSGLGAGRDNTTGERNYFSGYFAGFSNTTGRENVYIGYEAGRNGNFTNAIVIGANVAARGDNTVTIGNSGMTSIGGYAPWSNLSDGRFKREVAEDVPGLDFVTRLRPVSYQVDRRALHTFLHGEAADNENIAEEQPRETGFIAQEVEEVAQALGYAFNGIIQPQSEKDHYQLSYATFVVPLVQAVQEQQELIEALQAENTRLSQQNATQQTQLDQLGALQQRLQALENLLNQPTEATASN